MKEDFFVVCSQSIYFLTIAIECANEIRATVDSLTRCMWLTTAMASSLGHKKEISRGYAALFAMNAIFLKKKLVFTPTEFQK